MAARKGPLDDDEVREPVRLRRAAQEDVERAHARDDDAELGVAKARMIGHHRKGGRVQARREADAVDAAVERRIEAVAQRFEGVVHRELFHAVDEDEAVALLRAHDVLDVKARGALNLHRVEMHVGLRIEAGHVLVAAGLERRKACVRRSATSGIMASEMWPTPPRRATSSASSFVEMLTPMPPWKIGFTVFVPRRST